MRAEVERRLRELGVDPRKSRGQNFLVDPGAADEIIRFAAVTREEDVIEIGPGLGVLTEQLAKTARSVTAFEIEPAFCAGLRKLLSGVEVLEGNVLSRMLSGPKKVLVSNVPYSISSDVSQWIFREHRHISRASLLLQKEFAERLAADPGSRAYGSLTVLRSRFAKATLGAVIPGDRFVPETKVESRLVRLDLFEEPINVGVPEEIFERTVGAAFQHKRKTIVNSVRMAGLFPDREIAQMALIAAGIDPSTRAETLALESFIRLAREAAAILM